MIPVAVDDRLRDILEPLFAIAAVADAEQGSRLHVATMVDAANALAGVLIEHDADEAVVVAALRALEGICEPCGAIVFSARGALSLFHEIE